MGNPPDVTNKPDAHHILIAFRVGSHPIFGGRPAMALDGATFADGRDFATADDY